MGSEQLLRLEQGAALLPTPSHLQSAVLRVQKSKAHLRSTPTTICTWQLWDFWGISPRAVTHTLQ